MRLKFEGWIDVDEANVPVSIDQLDLEEALREAFRSQVKDPLMDINVTNCEVVR